MARNEVLETVLKVGLGVVVAKAVLAPNESWNYFLFGSPARQSPGHGLQGLGNNGVNPFVNALLEAITANQAHPQGQVAALSSANPVTTRPSKTFQDSPSSSPPRP